MRSSFNLIGLRLLMLLLLLLLLLFFDGRILTAPEFSAGCSSS
jgi:hypothetical protein